MEHGISTAQRFVNQLNMQIMPQLGYVRRNGRWEWPNIYSGFWDARSKWDAPRISTGEHIKDAQRKPDGAPDVEFRGTEKRSFDGSPGTQGSASE